MLYIPYQFLLYSRVTGKFRSTDGFLEVNVGLINKGSPGGSGGKESAHHMGDLGHMYTYVPSFLDSLPL